jgi:hypothetical protein
MGRTDAMSDAAWDGIFGLVALVVTIGGGFAFDAGWQVGGLLCVALGLLFLSAVGAEARKRNP